MKENTFRFLVEAVIGGICVIFFVMGLRFIDALMKGGFIVFNWMQPISLGVFLIIAVALIAIIIKRYNKRKKFLKVMKEAAYEEKQKFFGTSPR